MMWQQVYDPFGNAIISTLVAAIPIVVLLGGIGLFHMKAHHAALAGLVAALAIAVFAHGMPADKAGMTAVYGAAFGLLPIGWIVLNIIFLYQLTQEKGLFKVLQDSIAGITDDRRLQLLLIAFSFGAFFEGAAGFGTPVAVTGAILIGLGFSPLAASGLSLIANTAPVAFGALGTPIIALAAVTGLDLIDLSAMVGRQLPFFSVLVPFWLIAAFAGMRGMWQIWPAILIAGVTFAIPQFLVSNYHGPWLVDVVAAICSIGALTLFLKVWSPKEIWVSADGTAPSAGGAGGGAHVGERHDSGLVIRAWIPWIILSIVVFCWGIPQLKTALDGISLVQWQIPTLHNLVERVPPVVAAPAKEAAVYKLNWLSATGSGILISAIIAGFVMGFSPLQMLKTYWRTLVLVRYSLLTIAAMLALGFVTRYSGVDATLGLAFAKTGWLYPFFGALLGWLGVALTGSDTSSNVLFGSLQRISAEQNGLSPVLMAAANSSGGVMGKMIDAQSIVVASTATRWYGHEGDILRYVFFHSIVLACLMGLLITAQAYLWPFTEMVIHHAPAVAAPH
ncbi:L-lactate permease [Methylopila sp. M107]|uniref:L-lactate permease n=1 Tax=Methylopila sp. M107 TaxID=1101190 RepID=UPI0003790AE1|nr:L-lactate permease [Methylopila sp. M107]